MQNSLISCEGDIDLEARLQIANNLDTNKLKEYYQLLPKSLMDIADVSSSITALKLAFYFGGQKIYFSSNSHLLNCLKLNASERTVLASYLQGQQLDIPLANRALVCLLIDLGFSHKQIIKHLRICLSTVNRYL